MYCRAFRPRVSAEGAGFQRSPRSGTFKGRQYTIQSLDRFQAQVPAILCVSLGPLCCAQRCASVCV
jgi:hypothetical protein